MTTATSSRSESSSSPLVDTTIDTELWELRLLELHGTRTLRLYTRGPAGAKLWFIWKTLSGSYRFFTSTKRFNVASG
jgi:hypothetical protein